MKFLGALQPLLILTHLWTDIFMEFIAEIHRASDKLVIMVVVNHVLKYANFCALSHPFTPSLVA